MPGDVPGPSHAAMSTMTITCEGCKLMIPSVVSCACPMCGCNIKKTLLSRSFCDCQPLPLSAKAESCLARSYTAHHSNLALRLPLQLVGGGCRTKQMPLVKQRWKMTRSLTKLERVKSRKLLNNCCAFGPSNHASQDRLRSPAITVSAHAWKW